MKKVWVILACLTLAFGAVAQDVDDDVSSLFDNAEDIVVEESVPLVTVTTGSGGKIVISGSTKAVGGVVFQYVHDEYVWIPSATFSSALNFDARIDQVSSVHGTVKAKFPGKIDFSVSNLYLNTLLRDTWVTLGKKKTSWGNSRIFSGANTSLAADAGLDTGVVDASRQPDMISDSGNGFSLLARRNVLDGELSLICYTTRSTITTDASNPALQFAMEDLNYGFCYDTSFGQTGVSVLGRWYESPLIKESSTVYTREEALPPVIAFEQKRTVAGCDLYAQEQIQVTVPMPQVLLTGGVYRIWDQVPRMAVNVEVQDAWTTETGEHDVRLGLDAGISRLGKKKNGKVALSGLHDFSEQSGNLSLGFICDKILAHTKWISTVMANYTLDESSPETITKITAGTTLSLSLSY